MFHRRQSSAYVLAMLEYQAYWFGLDNHFIGFVRLYCRDDAEALEQSRRLVDHRPVELWCGERFIARLEPHSQA